MVDKFTPEDPLPLPKNKHFLNEFFFLKNNKKRRNIADFQPMVTKTKGRVYGLPVF